MAETKKQSPVTVDLKWNLSTPWGFPLKGTKKDAVERGLEVSKNPLSPEMDKTVENLNWGKEIKTTEDTNSSIVDQLKGSIESSTKQIEIAKEVSEANKGIIEEDRDKDTASVEDSYKKKNKILDDADAKVSAIETEEQKNLTKQKDEQKAILERERELALADAKSQIELTKKENALQNQRDRDAIVEARTWIELERQSSAIAFQKMGLWMSSWIVLESQRIATEWLTDIARLKVEAELNADKRDADVQKQLRGAESLSLQYTQNINTLISEYRTNSLNIKKSSVDRINKLAADKFGLEEELSTKKESILREARDAIREEDKNFIVRQKEERDRLIKDTHSLREEMRAQQEEKKAWLVALISSGKISQMSDLERKKLAEWAWMTLDELDFLKDNEVQTNIYSETARLLGTDYLLSEDEMRVIKSRVEGYLKSGKSLLEASTLAVKWALWAKAAAAKSKWAKEEKGRYKYVVDESWNQVRINQDTNVGEFVKVWGAGTPAPWAEWPQQILKVNTSANNTANKEIEEDEEEIDYLK